MAYGTINADVIQSSVSGVSLGAGNATVFKNRIINGDMRIDQRNSGASTTPTGDSYSLDRWKSWMTTSSKFSIQQNQGSVTPPAGFTNYIGVTSLAATSLGASDYYMIEQSIEGFNTADLDFGKSTAKTITISFWVRSSLTGTFGGSLNNSAFNRSYPFTYTISVANTWEQKSVTIAGDTTGTWIGATNGVGMGVWFSLGASASFSGTANAWAGANYLTATGATSVVSTNGATFYITGVQLEVGSLATGFEYNDYGRQLAQCQRYLPAWNNTGSTGGLGACYYFSTTQAGWILALPVTTRVPPTGITISSAGAFQIDSVGSNNVTALVISSTSQYALGVNSTDAGTNTPGWGGRPRFSGTTGQLLATGCEL
jgi:hypothetical protein